MRVTGLFKFDGYTLVKRTMAKKGQLQFMLKTLLDSNADKICKKLLLEIIVTEIFIKNAKYFLLACYYRPPEGSKYLPVINFSHNKEVLSMASFIVKL